MKRRKKVYLNPKKTMAFLTPKEYADRQLLIIRKACEGLTKKQQSKLLDCVSSLFFYN